MGGHSDLLTNQTEENLLLRPYFSTGNWISVKN